MKKYIGTPKEYLHLLIGNLGYALAFNLFLSKNNIAAGGFSGLGLVVSHFLPVSVGAVVFIVSVPIFIWSYFVQGAKYTLSALVSTAVFSAFLDAFSFLPNVTENKLLAAICGGALFGYSATILIRGRVSGSGTDLLSRLLVTKFRSLSLGTLTFACDAVIIAASVFAFGDLESGIYAAGSIVVASFVMDTSIKGLNRASMFQIITNTPAEELAQKISEKINRGVTLIPVKGMYKKEERNMLLVVVSRRQIYDMKDIIKQYAPDAFVMMLSANEIMGEGFSGLDVTVPVKKLDGGKKEGKQS